MNRRVTQQDIADRLGMHKSTVSLALRDNPGIALATRQRVRAMGLEMGYRPDPALATLARQRWAGHETGSGAAFAYLVDSRMDNAFMHRRFMPAARARAEARGYVLHEFDIGDYPSMKALSRVLHNRGIRGLLVPQFAHTDGPGILDLPLSNFTVICLDLGWVATPFHIVAPDMFAATRMAWHETNRRGYQRIGGAILSHTPRAVDDSTRYGASIDF
ncbi:LacI family DNA-binding transcriptional regulator [Synoicihabitans lomoniglobus]|uniref:LacI family DNA-binding transcriptional regulator n=1 Tax=Synoicihabitans lomoniglobus TaxID=2909285 RepID=A0AAE9ZVC7_9BACT|nr:LacI family DNA-binding transcriptional regulator [Opitutaceae bacterium LMO-M01]WED63158.1 LacI family DNA-binding transcriptional regulator [Opitutaceae bacterium LMO-M01]